MAADETTETPMIAGKAVSQLDTADSFVNGDLLLVSKRSETGDTYGSYGISKKKFLDQISSDLGHYENWVFTYQDVTNHKKTIVKQVFIG